jgi:hypothetical protein
MVLCSAIGSPPYLTGMVGMMPVSCRNTLSDKGESLRRDLRLALAGMGEVGDRKNRKPDQSRKRGAHSYLRPKVSGGEEIAEDDRDNALA